MEIAASNTRLPSFLWNGPAQCTTIAASVRTFFKESRLSMSTCGQVITTQGRTCKAEFRSCTWPLDGTPWLCAARILPVRIALQPALVASLQLAWSYPSAGLQRLYHNLDLFWEGILLLKTPLCLFLLESRFSSFFQAAALKHQLHIVPFSVERPGTYADAHFPSSSDGTIFARTPVCFVEATAVYVLSSMLAQVIFATLFSIYEQKQHGLRRQAPSKIYKSLDYGYWHGLSVVRNVLNVSKRESHFTFPSLWD